jgi:hypothetical protein
MPMQRRGAEGSSMAVRISSDRRKDDLFQAADMSQLGHFDQALLWRGQARSMMGGWIKGTSAM